MRPLPGWTCALLLAGCASSQAGEPIDGGVPWRAVVTAQSAWVFGPADAGQLRVALVTRGAVLDVTGCEAGQDKGALASGLQIGCGVLRPADGGEAGPPAPPVHWGTVRDGGAQVFSRPKADAGVLEQLWPPHTVALLADEALQQRGWLQRARGGYLKLDQVWLDRPSPFQGEFLPQLPLAFALKETSLALPPPLEGPAVPVARQARFSVLAADAQQVTTEQGMLPRAAVRLALPHPRPLEVPEGAKWVHVDLQEQVLTAYEGDLPVYATLVSTGTADTPQHRTHVGLHQVWLKSRHDLMHGPGYFVEEVPFILFFRGGEGLHGTFWHDGFGRRASHGCVNLSLADAQWLFDWAPPMLPEGWHTIYPGLLGAPTLFVEVEGGAPVVPALR